MLLYPIFLVHLACKYLDNVFELYYLPLNCQITCRIQLLGVLILIHHCGDGLEGGREDGGVGVSW